MLKEMYLIIGTYVLVSMQILQDKGRLIFKLFKVYLLHLHRRE